MSGFLGKCTIPRYGSVLAYENTSAKPASVTIGSQIPSTTENSCLSIKVDDTTNTIQSCSTLQTDVIASTCIIGYHISPSDLSYDGQIYRKDYTPGYSTFELDGTTTDNFVSTCRQPDVQTNCCNHPVGFPSNGWPTCFEQWETSCGCGISAKQYADCIQFNRYHYHPRSFSAQSAVNHFENTTSSNGYSVMPSWETSPSNGQVGGLAIVCSSSFLNLSNRDRHNCYFSGICCGCSDVICALGFDSCSANVGADYWSNTPLIAEFEHGYDYDCRLTLKYNNPCGGGSCFTTCSIDCQGYPTAYLGHDNINDDNVWNDDNCSSCEGFSRFGYPNNMFNGLCNGLLLQDPWDENTTTVSLFNTKITCPNGDIFSLSCYFYGWECANCVCSTCIILPRLDCGYVSWSTYDPYHKRNVIMVHSSDSSEAGYYEFNPDVATPFAPTCTEMGLRCFKWSSPETSITGISKLADFSGDDLLWEESFGCWTNHLRLPPYQVSDECWVSWVQCFVPYYNENSDDITCWNGCMIKYVSHDLLCWCEATDEPASYYINNADGNRLLIGLDINDNISERVDYFFNTSCIGNEGLIEYYTSANQYERTGLVIGPGDKVWIADDSGLGEIPVQVWGYDE